MNFLKNFNRNFERRVQRYYDTGDDLLSLDYETTGLGKISTTGLNIYGGAEVFSYSIGRWIDKDNIETYVKRGKQESILSDIKTIFNKSKALVIHNFLFELAFTKNMGIHIPENLVVHDTMIMNQMLRNLSVSKLEVICKVLGQYDDTTDLQVKADAKLYGDFKRIPKEKMYTYQKHDAIRPLLIFKTLWKDIRNNEKMLREYVKEIELIKVTEEMQRTGFTIDIDKSNKMLNKYKRISEKVQLKVWRDFGIEINLNSGKQVAYILYNILDYPKQLTDKKELSSKKDFLLDWRRTNPHPFLDDVLRYRTSSNAVKFIEGYLRNTIGGIIHPSIFPNHARTTRQSCRNPNLQNVEKKQSTTNPYAVPLRTAFINHKDSYTLFVDYSGIEMRLIANECKDQTYLTMYRKGDDTHAYFAGFFYGSRFTKAKNKEEKDMLRSSAKNGHFGIPYGVGPDKLASILQLPLHEIINKKAEFEKKHPGIVNFRDNVGRMARKTGYIVTPFGRIIKIRRDKPYSAFNYLIQGTAAGILKYAEIRLHELFTTEYHNKIKLILPIHDELVIKLPKHYAKSIDKLDKLISQCSKLMTTFPEITVNLEVEYKITKTNWNEVIPLTEYRKGLQWKR